MIMDRIKIYSLSAMLLICSCQPEIMPEDSPDVDRLVHVTLETGDSEATRTLLQENVVLWEDCDKVSVFDDEANRRFSVNPSGRSASFSGMALRQSSYIILYPYDGTASYAEGVLHTSIPDTQSPVTGGFDSASGLLCCMWEDNTALMRHVCGLLEFSISMEGIRQISLTAKDGTRFCGKAMVTFGDDGIPAEILTQSSAMKILPADGETFSEGRYFLNMAPCTIKNGMEVRFLMEDGTVRTMERDGTITVERGKVTVLEQPLDEGTFSTLQPLPDMLSVPAHHPRLFANDADFNRHKKAVLEQKSTILALMHNEVMATAVRCVSRADRMSNELDASGKRMLEMARDAFGRIFMCAYAYRFSGEERFLACAEDLLVQICSFPDWNKQNHYLDTSTLTHAAAVGYDWLYDSLSPDTRRLIEEVVFSYSLSDCLTDAATYLKSESAWNTTVTSAMILGAIAFHDINPELCSQLLVKGIESNDQGVRYLIGPDGSDHMGTMYWRNFAQMEMLSVSALRGLFLTDFGVSDYIGYRNTPKWYLNLIGNTGRTFAFGDNDESSDSVPAMMYFSVLHGDPTLPYFELEDARQGKVLTGGVRTADGQAANMRTYPLVLLWTSGYEQADACLPQDRVFAAVEGRQPVVVARTGWKHEDHYLAMKGGYAKMSHAHMDAGSFCYDAYGVRWATDPVQESYAVLEKAMAELGCGNLGDYNQNSARWSAFRINCRQHNTISVNDTDHSVTGSASFVSVHETDNEIGATLDLTSTLAGEVVSATRKAVIRDESYLSITDCVTASSDKSAVVRWNMCTEAVPALSSDGIILSRDGMTMKLSVTPSEGVEYRIWPNDPKLAEHPAPFCNVEAYRSGEYYCGYTVTVPAGEVRELEVTLKRII